MLTDTKLRSLKPPAKPRKIADSGGLFILFNPNGSKLWRLAYRFEKKQKTLSLGSYPTVSLSDARALRDKAKKALSVGIDPGLRDTNTGGKNSFGEIGREWLESQLEHWAPKYGPQVVRQFDRDVFPKLGPRPIDEIKPGEVLEVLRAVEERGAHDIAKRLRQKISAIFCYAIAKGDAEVDPASPLKKALRKPPKTKHMASLKASEMPEFFKRLNAYDGEEQTALCLRLAIHTMTRTNEVRFARWEEIEGNIWRIPEHRMKARREHLVPLTHQSLAILDRLKEIAGDSPWVAEGGRGKPISENTMLYALYRMGYHSRATTHGFRSTASTAANESGLWGADAIERQLAHVPMDQVRSAYNAALYLEERTRLMQWWSDRLDAWEAGSIGKTDLSDLLSSDGDLLV